MILLKDFMWAEFQTSIFLISGRKYDKDGHLVNWWSNSSNEAFERKSKCFVDQYSSYEAYGQKVNSDSQLTVLMVIVEQLQNDCFIL